jgi:hypothetical protein
MRNQYKILAEKYNLINEAFSSLTGNFNTEGSQDLIQALLKYTPCTAGDTQRIIDWMNHVYRKQLGFAPPDETSETNDDIFMQLVYVNAEENGLLDKANGDFILPNSLGNTVKAVAKQIYDEYIKHIGVSKEITKGSEEAGVNLDI